MYDIEAFVNFESTRECNDLLNYPNNPQDFHRYDNYYNLLNSI